MRTNWILPAVLVCIFLLGTSRVAEADSITWNFTGSASEGSIGNSRSFTAGGITATATAWSYGTSFQQARLGQWSTGLAVCGVPETCSNPAHQVDNVGEHEYVLFRLSAPVDPLTVRIDPYGTYDRDVSYWVGNVNPVNPSINLTGKLYGDLGSLGLLSKIDSNGTVSSSYRDVSISNPFSVNALLLGAKYLGVSDGQDRFKITLMRAAVPVPSTLPLLGFGILALVWFRWKQRGWLDSTTER